MSRNLADVADSWRWEAPRRSADMCDGQDWSGVAPLPSSPPLISATPYQWRGASNIPPRDWVYGRQLLRGSLSVVVAPGATGKTALMVGTSLALATGRAFLGKEVHDGPKRVWLWNLEDSGDEMARSLEAAAMHWRISPADVGDRLYVDSGLDGAELKIAHNVREGFTINEPVVEALVAELQRRQMDVLIVDPFVSSHTVSENDNGAIDAIAKEWARVAVRANCSVILVHHARKMAGGEVNAESARGAVALIAAARSVMVLNRMGSEEAERLGVDGEEHRRFFRTYDDKNNRAPPADKSDWHRMVSVSLNNGPNGGDNMPVVVPWEAPATFDGMSVKDLIAVQARVAQGEWRASDQTTDWVGIPIAEALDFDLDKPSHKRRVKTMLKAWLEEGVLRTEHRKDSSRQTRPYVVVGREVRLDP